MYPRYGGTILDGLLELNEKEGGEKLTELPALCFLLNQDMIKPLSTASHKPFHRVDRMLQNEGKINSLPSLCFMLGTLSAMSKAAMPLPFFTRQPDRHITGEVQVWRPLIFPTLPRAAWPPGFCSSPAEPSVCHSLSVLQRGLEWEGGRAGWSLRPIEAWSTPCSEHEGRALLMDLCGSQSISRD